MASGAANPERDKVSSGDGGTAQGDADGTVGAMMDAAAADGRAAAEHVAAARAGAAVLAAVCVLGLSVNLAGTSPDAVHAIDRGATGVWYIFLEVVCSFPSRSVGLALAALWLALVRPFERVFFDGLGARPSRDLATWFIPAVFAAAQVFGTSFDLTDSATLVTGGIAQGVRAAIAFTGWLLAAHVGMRCGFHALERLRSRPARCVGAMTSGFSRAVPLSIDSEPVTPSVLRTARSGGDQTSLASHASPVARPVGDQAPPLSSRSRIRRALGRAYRRAVTALDARPVATSALVIGIAWLPCLIGYAPGLFMWDTGTQILAFFGYPNNASRYLDLIDPAVTITQHHPPASTALVGGCVALGRALLGSDNAGALLYTMLQWATTVAAVAWAIGALKRLGVRPGARIAVLAFVAVVPVFSTYAVTMTKDVIFADALLVLALQLAVAARASWSRCSAQPAQASRVVWTACDTARLAVAALGLALFRNGGWAVAIVALVIAALVCYRRTWRPRRNLSARPASPLLATAVLVFGVQVALTGDVYPALKITPGSVREAFSIPFQQTARYFRDHATEVTSEEYAAVDAVLDADTLAECYDPEKSDAVKNAFNEDATTADLVAYLRAWFAQLMRDPACYLEATANSYYGYCYVGGSVHWSYSSAFSHKVMAWEQLAPYFDFHAASNPVSRALDTLCTGYRAAWQHLPLLTLALSAAVYVWALVVATACAWRCRARGGNGGAVLVAALPVWFVLAVALVGPCNATTYTRYAYPIMLAAPFLLALVTVGERDRAAAVLFDAEGPGGPAGPGAREAGVRSAAVPRPDGSAGPMASTAGPASIAAPPSVSVPSSTAGTFAPAAPTASQEVAMLRATDRSAAQRALAVSGTSLASRTGCESCIADGAHRGFDADFAPSVSGAAASARARIAVLIPCYNEERTVGTVVDDFRRALPDAIIYVYDNNSTDATAAIARAHGAQVRFEPRQGKGNAVRQMFRDIEADVYLMVDGDDTYPAEAARTLIDPILEGRADMTVGDRLSNGTYAHENTRAFHGFGNDLVRWLIKCIYGYAFHDVMTGYRAFSRLFVKTMPVLSPGFQIECELSIHAVDHRWRILEVPIAYRDRPAGSASKLSTVSDGIRVLMAIGALFKDCRPLKFFCLVAAVLTILGLVAGVPVVGEFVRTGYVSRVPSAILAVGFIFCAALALATGAVLDTVAKAHRRAWELEVYRARGQGRTGARH